MKTITILGSTGSIGQTTLNLVKQHQDKFQVLGLCGGNNLKQMIADALFFKPKFISMSNEKLQKDLESALAGHLPHSKIICGEQASHHIAQEKADIFISAIVGSAGLIPTMEAIKHGTQVALANKESLVCAGNLMLEQVRKSQTTLLPIDSEHNAIFQVLQQNHHAHIEKILLTCSGGPFRTKDLEFIRKATPAQAVAHPKWSMGNKISVDSASLMNKGLEWIEASHLFNVDCDKIQVVIHPQSIIHSMVAYDDGSVLAQLGSPDMAVPISYALDYPKRLANNSKRIDFWQCEDLTFQQPDETKFKALKLSRSAFKANS